MKKAVIDDYLAETPRFVRALSKKEEGRFLRKFTMVARVYAADLRDDMPEFDGNTMKRLNNVRGLTLKRGYGTPEEMMWKKLEERYHTSIFEGAFEISAVFDAEKFQVKRVFKVPLRYTFLDLHCALQYLFGWEFEHLFEFSLKDDRKLVCNEEARMSVAADLRKQSLSRVP